MGYVMNENPMKIFGNEAPEVAKAVNDLITSLVASKGLDQKTKQSIHIAMKASMGDEMALKAHVSIGETGRCDKNEVVDAILMTLTVPGDPYIWNLKKNGHRWYFIHLLFLIFNIQCIQATTGIRSSQLP